MSRGIKVIAVLAFIGLFAPCLTSYAAGAGDFVEPYTLFCKDCYKGHVPDHQRLIAGGAWGKNSLGEKSGDFVEPDKLFCPECFKGKVPDHQRLIA